MSNYIAEKKYSQRPILHTDRCIMKNNSQLRRRGPNYSTLDESVWAGLGRIHFGVLTGVFETLVPFQVCKEC